MPIAKFQLEDGRVARFEVPDGTSPEQAQAMIKAEIAKLPPKKQNVFGGEGFANAMQEVLKESSGFDKAAAAFGSGARNLYEGAKQMFGLEDKRAILGNQMIRDASPKTSFAGDVAAFVPTAVIPGANTLTGAALSGGAYGMFQPAENTQHRAMNTGLGVAMGGVGKSIGDDVSQAITNRMGRKTAEAAEREAGNVVHDATIRSGRDAGYKLPPSAVGKSSAREVLSGQQKTQQAFAWENQQATNDAWRRQFNLPEKTTPITQETMDKVRFDVELPYREAEKLGTLSVGPSPYAKVNEFQKFAGMQPYKQKVYTIEAGETIFKIRDLRQKGYKLINGPYSPENEALGYSMLQESAVLEELLAEGLANSGRPELAGQILDARKVIAQSHLGDKAIVHGAGDINAHVIADAYRKGMAGQGPKLSGELETIGKFSNTFPQQTAWRSFAPLPNSPLDAATSSIVIGAGQGHPAALAAGAVPFMRNPVRSWLLSEGVQNKLMNPTYQPGLMTRGMNEMRNLPPALAEGIGLGLLGPYFEY